MEVAKDLSKEIATVLAKIGLAKEKGELAKDGESKYLFWRNVRSGMQ